MLSLKQLEKELNERIINPDFTDLKNISSWFSELEIENISTYYNFDENNYHRVILFARDEYDLLICCWKTGQGAPFHGHPSQGCLVKMLEGSLQEEIKFADGKQSVRLNKQGAIAYITDSMGIHQVHNVSDKNAVSLHLYAPGGYKPAYH